MDIREVTAQMAGKKPLVGAKQIRKALGSGTALFVYLAENADPAITEPLAAACRKNKIAIGWVRTMKDLGMACGIEVGATAAAIE